MLSKTEQKESFSDEGSNKYYIIWHWNESFRQFQAHSLQTATPKLTKIKEESNNNATRLFFINNKLCLDHSYWKDVKWENKIKLKAHQEGFTFIEIVKSSTRFSISSLTKIRDKHQRNSTLIDDEEKDKDHQIIYNILWHQNESYQRYETESYIPAITKWNKIPNKSSRVFLKCNDDKNRAFKYWYHNDSWKQKLHKFADSESLSFEDASVSLESMTNKLNETKFPNKCKFLKDGMYYAAMQHRDQDCAAIPLLESLECHTGFIEFDVCCDDGKTLSIGHDKGGNKTMESVYLEPLREYIEKKIVTKPVYLFVDFKSDGNTSFRVLQDLIKNNYSDIVRSWKYATDDDNYDRTKKLVNIVITGNRDIECNIDGEEKRFVSFDGRIEDIDRDIYDNEYMPMISDNFQKVFGKKGNKDFIFNDVNKQKLQGYIEKCRKMNKRLRFWGIKDESPRLWQQLIDLDVDRNVIVINTDKQAKLIPFLIQNGY